MSTCQARVQEWQSDREEIQEWSIIESESDFGSGLLQAEIESAEEKLTALADNWDGEGSAKYNRETLDKAAEFLRSQDKLILGIQNRSLPVPQINPGPDGSIDLFWKQPTWELLVNVPARANEGASFYGEDNTGQHIKGSFGTSIFNLELVMWLMK